MMLSSTPPLALAKDWATAFDTVGAVDGAAERVGRMPCGRAGCVLCRKGVLEGAWDGSRLAGVGAGVGPLTKGFRNVLGVGY